MLSVAQRMIEILMPQRTFSVWDIKRSQEESPSFREGRMSKTEKFKVNKQVRNKIKPSSGTNGRYRYYLGLQFENGRFSTDFKNTNQGKGPLFVSNFLDLSQTLYIQ